MIRTRLYYQFTFAIVIFLITNDLKSQCIIRGADLSYVNSIQQNGGEYRDQNGIVVDPYEYFSEEGCDMVRLRLWHNPGNIIDYCGNPIESNSLPDVLDAAKKSKDAGMEIMLAMHYGDYFNDPGKQLMPKAWIGLSHQILLDSIYNYTYNVLEKLNSLSSLPSIIGIGNETTWGFIDNTSSTNGWKWPEDAQKFNIAFEAVDDFNLENNTEIKKAVHFTYSTAEWLSGLFTEKEIINYDIIGISYYPVYSPDASLSDLSSLISTLNAEYAKDIMIFETGFVWAINGWVDSYNNIFNNNGNVIDLPASPEGQLEYMNSLCENVEDAGGSGVFYWEPGYITSDMCTKWGKGSPYENVCFFDFNNANQALAVFDFFDDCESNLLAEIENENSLISTYPNPITSNQLFIESKVKISSWEIHDLMGNEVKKEKLSIPVSRFKINMDLNPGIYFLTIKTKSKKTTIVKLSHL